MKVDKLKKEGEALIKRGSKIAKEIKENAQEYTKAAVGCIKKYPVQSTLAAVTIGVILGKIFRRHRH